MEEVLEGPGSEIFANHAVLVEQVLVALLDCVELLFELADILLLGHLHLLQNLLLRVQLAVQVLSLRHRLIDLVLELQVLLLKDLNLSIGRVQLDLCVFESQDLVLEL